jgi:hypothetical protein
MSSLSEIARQDALPISTDLAESQVAAAIASYEADHAIRPVPSFWKFEDDDARPGRSRVIARSSQASSRHVSSRS